MEERDIVELWKMVNIMHLEAKDERTRCEALEEKIAKMELRIKLQDAKIGSLEGKILRK